MPQIITLTTDFGPGSYVAQMKGVILSICPDANLVDISHSIGPQNVREGAVVLADATERFPAGTIHVAVVDPGVGTARRLIYAEIGAQRYLAPDNGLLSLLAKREAEGAKRIVALENARFWLPKPSSTFHGRDILAPVAAHLARGVDPRDLGPPREEMVTLDWPNPRVDASGIAGEVLFIDAFGNLITNISRQQVETQGNATALLVECGGVQIRGMVSTYGAAMQGELVALVDSQGRLEIALASGNAAKTLNARVGDPVRVS